MQSGASTNREVNAKTGKNIYMVSLVDSLVDRFIEFLPDEVNAKS